jgi:hypothetical protein
MNLSHANSITDYLLLFSLAFLVGGFTLINKFGMCTSSRAHPSQIFTRSITAPEATQVGEHTITQKHLYVGLFVIGIPMFLWAGPIGTFFGIFFGSTLLILIHASILEPGVESDYASIQDTV